MIVRDNGTQEKNGMAFAAHSSSQRGECGKVRSQTGTEEQDGELKRRRWRRRRRRGGRGGEGGDEGEHGEKRRGKIEEEEKREQEENMRKRGRRERGWRRRKWSCWLVGWLLNVPATG